ncbi:MAG: tRNA lysidine(34) synthetase TilS, partial [Bacteroidota bacterium]
METIIQKFITDQQLFQKEDRLLLAVSGGMDSMVMAQLLHKMGYSIALVHCNFQLRGEASDADQQLVVMWGSARQLTVHVKVFDTKAFSKKNKLSTQMAARDLRYAYFTELLENNSYDYLLTAHHLDDRLETFWLNFSRGTGVKG